ncbi:MAG: GNAT family N-acetyltransferase [Dehalococcoidia bacterium]|nr:GNAT family N-acetyltransferase [Dehalococcoidia bacterium]
MKQGEVQKLLHTIRPAAPEDAEAAARIYIDSWNEGFGELMSQANRTVTADRVERWRHDLAQPVPHRWWVAEHEGSIVGFAGIGPSRDPVDPQLGELYTIAIDPPYWRQGIGKALISLALRHLVSDGYRKAILWTVEGYERGIAFYETMRWSRDGGVRDNGRQIRFRRDLAPLRAPPEQPDC